MERYREEKNQATRKTKNMMHSQMVLSEGSTVHSEHDLSTTGPRVVISTEGSVKEGPG